MWLYYKEAEEIEVITHLETGHQVVRSANEISWRGNQLNAPVEQDEMRIGEYLDSDSGKRLFHRLLGALYDKDELVGWRFTVKP